MVPTTDTALSPALSSDTVVQHATVSLSESISSSNSNLAPPELKPQPQSARTLLSLASGQSVTYAGQGQLPRLPIPTLVETMEKLPRVLQALQDEQQQVEMTRAIDEFMGGPGPVLQHALEEYEAANVASGAIGSYVEEFWNESYLSPDASVVLNLNPFFVLEEGPDPVIAKDQLRRAASLCLASIKLASLLKNETLEPDVFRGKPLCMDQFKVLFGASRQPNSEGSDDVHVYSDSRHGRVVVAWFSLSPRQN
jgi:carnitine O-acetyltransferase